jgi:cytochrome c biogenesis protein CcdA
MIAALVLLGFGYNYKSVPPIVADLFDKTSAMMTPLVLIFIGLAVQLKKGNKRLVFSILAFRSGITLLFSALVIKLLQITDPTMVLIATVIPQSSASFWPFAHISAFNAKEDSLNLPKEKRTFNLELAVLILAFSLPFSTLLILGILSAGKLFVNPTVTVAAGFILILLGTVPNLLGRVFVRVSDPMMKN